MIPRIAGRSDSPGQVVDYLASTAAPRDPGQHHNVHVDPHIVTGNLGYTGSLDKGTIKQVIGDLKAPYLTYPDVSVAKGAIWHFSLAIKAEEGSLPDSVWAEIGEDFMRGMGLIDEAKAPVRWVLIEHGPSAGGNHHVHGVANLIREDGTKASVWNDYRRSHAVARELETKYGLQQVEPTPGTGRGYNIAEIESARRRGLAEPDRMTLERHVRAAAGLAKNEDEFTAHLRDRGLQMRPRIQDGRVVGYSVRLAEDGPWYGGGKLAPDLSLPRLRLNWPPTLADAVASWRNPAKVSDPYVGEDVFEVATGELRGLEQALRSGSDAGLVESASRDISAVLSAASTATEQVPGRLAEAAKQASGGAATRRYQRRRYTPTLSGVTMIAAAAADRGGNVSRTLFIRQLMNTYKALMDYRRALGAAGQPSRRTRMEQGTDGVEDAVQDIAGLALMMGARAIEVHYLGRTRALPKVETGRGAERPPEISGEEWRGMDGVQREQASVEEPWRAKTPTKPQMEALFRAATAQNVTLDDPHSWSRGQVSDALDAMKKKTVQEGAVLTQQRAPEENRKRLQRQNISTRWQGNEATRNRPGREWETRKGPSPGRY